MRSIIMLRNHHLALALLLVGLSAIALACEPSGNTSRLKKKDNNVTGGEGDPNAANCTEVGASYLGFANTKLEDGRVRAAIGADRARIKPYSALRAEYERVLGAPPNGIDQAGPTFGAAQARYSTEPRASAIQVYASFRLAFEGCLTYVANNPESMSEAPTKESASAECTAMARSFWSRKASKEEVEACTQVALVDSESEGAPDRRWAYTCASLLSSAGFLTY